MEAVEVSYIDNSDNYKYNEKGKCPRCRSKLLPATSYYCEVFYKDKYKCFSCGRLWAYDKARELILIY